MKSAFTWLCVLTTVVHGAPALACSGAAASIDAKGVDLSWVKSTLTIYGVDDSELYEAKLNSTERKRLAATVPGEGVTLSPSPDGRFLLYTQMQSRSEQDDEQRSTVRHLFDRQSGTDRIVPVLKEPEGYSQLALIGFSPDSRWIAWQNHLSGDNLKSPESMPTLVVFDTATLERKELVYPRYDDATKPARNCFLPQWGLDSRVIYSNSVNSPWLCAVEATDRHKLAYFKTDIATGAATRVDGGYSYDDKRGRFSTFYTDAGTRVDLPRACYRSYGCSAYGERVIEGDSQAWLHHDDNESGTVDGDEKLFVQSSGKAAHQIDMGYSSSCSGTNIRIIDWIDDGKYLLYHLAGNTYIYGIDEDKSSVLPQLTGSYAWLPYKFGAKIYSQGGRTGPDGENLIRPSQVAH